MARSLARRPPPPAPGRGEGSLSPAPRHRHRPRQSRRRAQRRADRKRRWPVGELDPMVSGRHGHGAHEVVGTQHGASAPSTRAVQPGKKASVTTSSAAPQACVSTTSLDKPSCARVVNSGASQASRYGRSSPARARSTPPARTGSTARRAPRAPRACSPRSRGARGTPAAMPSSSDKPIDDGSQRREGDREGDDPARAHPCTISRPRRSTYPLEHRPTHLGGSDEEVDHLSAHAPRSGTGRRPYLKGTRRPSSL
jgi:hypothetical protein